MSHRLHTTQQRDEMHRRANAYAQSTIRSELDPGQEELDGRDLERAWRRGFEAGLREAAKRYAERANGDRV